MKGRLETMSRSSACRHSLTDTHLKFIPQCLLDMMHILFHSELYLQLCFMGHPFAMVML